MTSLGRGVRAVAQELRRLREEGEEAVYVSDEVMERLRESLAPPAPVASGQAAAGFSTGPSRASASRSAAPATPKPRPASPASLAPPAAKPAPKSAPKPAAPELPPPPEVKLPEGDKETRWNALKEIVTACPTCNANLNPGAQVVFGVGNRDADLFLCGEAPGAEEEMQGEPFVGPAGDLLNKILGAAGLSREEVYIGNVMNWRPKHEKAYGNRPPTIEEMNFCLPYLKAQIEVVRPKVILALGRSATAALVEPDPTVKMGALRGCWWEFAGTPVMPTYHPSYLLHNPSNAAKRRVWEDFLLVMERLNMSISDKQRNFFR